MKRRVPADVEEELRNYLDSTPPPRGIADARDRLEARFRDRTASAIHDLDDLQRQMREAAVAQVKQRLEDEQEARRTVEKRLDDILGWIWKVAGTVVAGLILAGCIWAAAQLNR